jgi:nicotinate phosphoribosyltransferase
MAYAEWQGKRAEMPCVFEAFFRKAPFKGRYTIFAGLEEVLNFISQFKFGEKHINYLKTQLPHMDPAFFEWLFALDTKCLKVYGVTDGTLVYANEPLIRLEGPFALLQILETPILNLINFASLITTNASRMYLKS